MNDTSNKSKKTNKLLTVIIIVLIIIIILLLLKGCSKNNEDVSHVGKTNIFEIKCDGNCNCECENNNNTTDNDNDDNSNDNTKEVIKEVDGNSNINNAEVDIKVLDNNKTWQNTTDIDIFEDSTYVVKGKIAPESTGTYQFMVKNSTSYNVKYDVKFDETNNYNINMKYKLKKNNNYITSDWVSYSELSREKIRLNSNSTDTYYLEWKWISSSNDNSIGEDINSKYGLSINIRAVQAND